MTFYGNFEGVILIVGTTVGEGFFWKFTNFAGRFLEFFGSWFTGVYRG